MNEQNENLEEIFIQVQRLTHHYYMIKHRKKQTMFDIRQGQGRILALMKKVNSITQKELSEIFGIRQQSLGESLLKLEQNGYITRKQSQEDKRVMIVEITEKGKELEFEKTDLNEIFDCLNEQEQQNFKNYLYRISQRLENILQSEQQKTNGWGRNRREDFSREREGFSREREGFEQRGFRERQFGERNRHFEREYFDEESGKYNKRCFRGDFRHFDRNDFE